MKIGIFISFIVLLTLSRFSGKTLDPQKLDAEISSLNNKNLYEKSILRLQQILDDPNSSHYERYNAYLQRYLTYKKVSDFAVALENLKAAKKEGQLSNRKKECDTRIAIEDIFLKVELQEFEKVKKILSTDYNKINLKLVDHDTQGFYFCTLAIIEILDSNFLYAEKHLDQATKIFMKYNPRHLANVYRKKVDLYIAIGNEGKALEAYKNGLYYAKKYQIDIYEKGMYDSMAEYYKKHYNPKMIDYYINLSKKTPVSTYKTLNENERLKNLELKINANKGQREQKNEENVNFFFILILFLLTIVAFYFYKQYKTKKKKFLTIQNENQKIKNLLLVILKDNEDHSNELETQKQKLTERQLQILELLKKGKTNKEIGQKLFISENTVKYHLKIIYNTLKVQNRFELQE